VLWRRRTGPAEAEAEAAVASRGGGAPAPAAVSSGVKLVEAELSGGADAMRRLARDEEHDAEAFARREGKRATRILQEALGPSFLQDGEGDLEGRMQIRGGTSAVGTWFLGCFAFFFTGRVWFFCMFLL